MKHSLKPIDRDPEKVKELAEKKLRYAGTGWKPGTVHTAEDGKQYITTPNGSFMRIKTIPSKERPGHSDIAIAKKLRVLSPRQQRKFNKAFRKLRNGGSNNVATK